MSVQKYAKEKTEFHCPKCEVTLCKPSNWLSHIYSNQHIKNYPENNINDLMKNYKKKITTDTSNNIIETKKSNRKEFKCEACKTTLYHITNWNLHVNSEKHKRNGQPKPTSCTLCNRSFINHITQRHHMLSAHSTKEDRVKEKYYCDCCDVVFISKMYHDKHNSGKKHLIMINALESYKTV